MKYNTEKTLSAYGTGDLVLVRACNLSDKLLGRSAKFMAVFEGPYLIKRMVRESTAILVDPKSGVERGMFHVNDIKKILD